MSNNRTLVASAQIVVRDPQTGKPVKTVKPGEQFTTDSSRADRYVERGFAREMVIPGVTRTVVRTAQEPAPGPGDVGGAPQEPAEDPLG